MARSSRIATSSAVALLLLLLVAFAPISRGLHHHQCEEEQPGEDPAIPQLPTMAAAVPLGGAVEVGSAENSAEVEELARFAVDEHNKKENALLQFSRVVKAKEQVVAGVMHHITVEAIEGGKKKLYEAQVWVQAWLNSTTLHDFKHVGDSPQ